MKKTLLNELSNIISAYKEGKTLQFYTSYGELKDVSAEEFDIEKWYKKPKKFCIKPEPKYRPFANTEECWAEMQKHQPFGWLKVIRENARTIVNYIHNKGVIFNNGSVSFERMFDNYTFADGTPFGVKVEE
mgnify:FL=1